MEKRAELQYWLFQAHPSVFRLRDALRYEALETFAVKAHRDRIKPGDKVILWQAGPDAGCYGLATVVSGVEERPPAEPELVYFREAPYSDLRVRLRVDYNLWYKPVTRELLPDVPPFQALNAGVPGTNFKATAEQYRQLVDQVEQLDLLCEPEVPYIVKERVDHPLNLILYGPPGTGKTYLTMHHALGIIENRSIAELSLEEESVLRRRFNEYLEGGQVVMVTFHPSFSYEDFVEGIKPASTEGQLEYLVAPGIFKTICERATEEEQPNKRYVVIIDEINRGNMAGIFGELITLLEPNKRVGKEEALQVVLPYSKTPFSIPDNLYLIGTMNSTDRSTEMMDAALRRRFAFRELRPDPALIPRLAGGPIAAGVDLPRLLSKINERIALLLDADYCIGHGYFQGVQTLDDLRRLFDERLLPLLQDYFYNDLGKIGLVLGGDFVLPLPLAELPGAFADFEYPFAADTGERQQFELRRAAQLDEPAFIRIYDPGYEGTGSSAEY